MTDFTEGRLFGLPLELKYKYLYLCPEGCLIVTVFPNDRYRDSIQLELTRKVSAQKITPQKLMKFTCSYHLFTNFQQ